MRWFRENRCFDGSTSMNFAVFTKCVHEFRCFHEVSSWIWAIWPMCLLFQKTETSQLLKINLLGSDEGKWDSWNFEIAYTRNGLSDEFDGSYLIISNIWWTRSYEVGRLRCSWLRIKKIQVYTLGEHESLENEGTSVFWMLMKIEAQQWFWWIWGSRACNLAVFHAISLFSMQNMVKIAVLTAVLGLKWAILAKRRSFSATAVFLLTGNRVFRTHMVPLDRGNSGDHGDTHGQKVIFKKLDFINCGTLGGC